MGVRHFSTFIKENHKSIYTSSVDLHGSKIIVDGDALMHNLIREFPLCFGGEYSQFFSHCTHFFNKLSALDIIPYIVLDGCVNIELKYETTIQRNMQRIGCVSQLRKQSKVGYNLPTPLFTKAVFVEAMRASQVNFIIAHSEADLLLAAYANLLECPVFSNDSDLYLMNIDQGLIPLNHLFDFASLRNVKVYHIENLQKLLKIEIDKLPYIPLIMGNDYTKDEQTQNFQQQINVNKHFSATSKIKSIAKFLENYKTSEEINTALTECIDELKNSLLAYIGKIVSQYDVNNCRETAEDTVTLLTNCHHLLESCIKLPTLTSYVDVMCHMGYLHSSVRNMLEHDTHFVHVQCEDIAMKCASTVAHDLIRAIARLLGKTDKFTLISRYAVNYKPKSLMLDNFNVDLDDLSTAAEKREFLFSLVNLSVKRCEMVKKCDILFILSMRYWYVMLKKLGRTINQNIVKSLIYSYTNCSNNFTGNDLDEMEILAAHGFCEWQSCLHYMNILNGLLKFPVSQTQLHRMFGGRLAHSTYTKLTKDSKRKKPTVIFTEREVQLFDVITMY